MMMMKTFAGHVMWTLHQLILPEWKPWNEPASPEALIFCVAVIGVG